MTEQNPTETEALGDAITEWTWEWSRTHRNVLGTNWQVALVDFIRARSDLPFAEANSLAAHITCWARVWVQSAEEGYADADFGGEWRSSLMRLIALTHEEREAWGDKPWEWKLHNVHFDGGNGVWQQDRPDFPHDVKGVVVRGPAYDGLGNSKVIAFIACDWEQADDIITLLKERIPASHDAHEVIVDVDDVPVFDGVTAYLDHLAEGDDA